MVMWVAKAPVKINMRFTSDDPSAVGKFKTIFSNDSDEKVIKSYENESSSSSMSFHIHDDSIGLNSMTTTVQADTNNLKSYDVSIKVERTSPPPVKIYDDLGQPINADADEGWVKVLSGAQSGSRNDINWAVDLS